MLNLTLIHNAFADQNLAIQSGLIPYCIEFQVDNIDTLHTFKIFI